MVGGMEPFFDPFPRISCPQMSLNTAQIRAFSGSDTPYKKADEKGLYLEVFPNESKLWRFKYRVLGKEKRMALGAWPEVGLSQARHMRDELRIRISNGEDPAMTRKREKALSMVSASNTFASVAQEYIDTKMIGEERAEATLKKARWFLDLLKPAIGSLPISDIDPQIMLAPLKRLEARGNRETAKKCRAFASRVFRYGAATGRCNADPTAILQGALVSPKARHYAAILEPGKLGELLRAIHAWDGPVATRYARVDLPAEAFDGECHGRGTTNVDFNTPMRNALLRLRDNEDVEFAVGKDEVVLSKGNDKTIEKKVKLPLRWIKGFSEVQAYQPRLDLKMEVSAATGWVKHSCRLCRFPNGMQKSSVRPYRNGFRLWTLAKKTSSMCWRYWSKRRQPPKQAFRLRQERRSSDWKAAEKRQSLQRNCFKNSRQQGKTYPRAALIDFCGAAATPSAACFSPDRSAMARVNLARSSV
jgi:hypothetical protein